MSNNMRRLIYKCAQHRRACPPCTSFECLPPSPLSILLLGKKSSLASSHPVTLKMAASPLLFSMQLATSFRTPALKSVPTTACGCAWRIHAPLTLQPPSHTKRPHSPRGHFTSLSTSGAATPCCLTRCGIPVSNSMRTPKPCSWGDCASWCITSGAQPSNTRSPPPSRQLPVTPVQVSLVPRSSACVRFLHRRPLPHPLPHPRSHPRFFLLLIPQLPNFLFFALFASFNSLLHSLPVLILFFTGVFVFALSPDEYRPFYTSRHSFQTVTACPFISGSLFFSFTNTAPGSLKVPPSDPPQRKCDVLAGKWRSRARLLHCRYCSQRAIRGGKC